MHAQYVADDADAPHVSAEVDRFVMDDFRCHELWGSKQNPRVDVWVMDASQAEVDDLDAVSCPRQTQNVFRLQTKFHDT